MCWEKKTESKHNPEGIFSMRIVLRICGRASIEDTPGEGEAWYKRALFAPVYVYDK